MLANPRNCEMIILGHDGRGKLQLTGRSELVLEDKKEKLKESSEGNDTAPGLDGNNGDDEVQNAIDVSGYKFYRKLRIVPRCHMRARTIRLSPKS